VDAFRLAVAAAVGVAVGLFYFAGLWWTVRRAPSSRTPGLLVLGSFLVRTAVAAVAMVLVGRGDWMAFVACLVGFVAARIILVRKLRPAK
jgi:F1F0 ATPase subunit 2